MSAPKVDLALAPTQPLEVAAAEEAVSRSWPNKTRPRLSTATEDRFEDIERRSAACYAGMEAMTARLDAVRQDIESDAAHDDEPANGMPEAWADEDDSLVTSIDAIKTLAPGGGR